MDLLIQTDTQTYELSKLGVLVKDIKAQSPTFETTRTAINFKNGKLFGGANYSEKKITVTGSYYADDEYADLEMQDKLNSLFATLKPFYISPMLRTSDMYDFERPGEKSGSPLKDVDDNLPYHYRYEVIIDGEIDYEFVGKSGAGLLSTFTVNFVTASLPFGVTLPEDETYTSGSTIPYNGTTAVSQLEWPFYFVLISTEAQETSFTFAIGDDVFSYKSDTVIKQGDVFELKGMSFLLNGLNINDKTNIQYFTFRPNEQIKISTDFKGEIELKNKVAFYV